MNNFINLSSYAGMREDLVQAGGGNSSVKLEKNKMIIKASGVQLSEITSEYGYTVVDPEVIKNYFNNTSFEKMTEAEGKIILAKAIVSGNRPSIETFLHSITKKYTLHTHPTLVNVLTARKGGFDILKQIFSEAIFVDYATPGIELAKKYFNAFKETLEKDEANIVFLKNHGLLVSSDDSKEVIKITEDVIKKIAKYLKVDNSSDSDVTKIYFKIRELENEKLKVGELIENKIVYLSKDIKIKNAIGIFGEKLWEYWFCPDCMVYCGKRPLILSDINNSINIEDIRKHVDVYEIPVIIYYKDNIYIVADSLKKAKEIESVLSFSAEVAIMNKECEMDLLTESEQNYLLDWDAEKYRKNLK